MRLSQVMTTPALCALGALLASAVAEAGDGYVGVFGDAAGTIRCMQAPPGVPTTLYVVAKTAGATTDGITGTEFRIEFSNPSGYYMSYTAPGSSTSLGDPLSATGYNISFPSCRTPVDSLVSLGTITVFNGGSGGPTDIIVKRRNPPTNANYQCALLVQCDAPVYTKACNTAPADSVSCLTQKANFPPIVGDDEFGTYLDGSSPEVIVVREYEGYHFRSCFYALASCEIEKKNPSVGWSFVASWVGLDDGVPTQRMQAGWLKEANEDWASTYYERVDKNGTRHFYDGYEAPDMGLYGVEMTNVGGTLHAKITVAGTVEFDRPWEEVFGDELLSHAQFGVEAVGELDRTPGFGTNANTETDPCHFDSAKLRLIGQNTPFAPTFSVNPAGLHRPAHSSKKSYGAGSFITWYFP